MERTEKMTSKELKKQFNLLGAALLLMTALAWGSEFGYRAFIENYETLLQGYNMTAVNTGIEIAAKILICMLPFFLIRFLLKIRFGDLFNLARVHAGSVFSFACGGVAAYLFLTFVFSSITYALNPNGLQMSFVHPAIRSKEMLLTAVYLIYFIFVEPLVEEYVYRGVILRCTSRAGGIFGMISSALIYTAAHLTQSNPAVTLALGMYLALPAMIYRSIWPSYVAHAAINLTTAIGFFIPGQYSWVFGIIAVAVYAVSIYALISSRGKKLVWNHDVPMRAAWKCFFTSWLLIFAIILLILRVVYYIII